MLRQTLAIFIDSYRELAARKILWISVIISGFVVLAMAAVGYAEDGSLSLLWFKTGLPLADLGLTKETLYKTLFMGLGLNIWLAWGATILALVSTAGVFPDFMSAGAIDLALSKPIGRVRLMLTKYAAAMLFTAAQVAVFCAASFLVIGLRGGVWEPAIFLAVPLVVLFYSYLYCLCALVGILTRSAMTALVVTLVLWFVIFLVGSAENTLLTFRTQYETRVHTYETTLAGLERHAADLGGTPEPGATVERARQYADGEVNRIRLERTRDNLESARETRASLQRYHRLAFTVKTALPKTGETIGLLERALIDSADMESITLGGEDRAAVRAEIVVDDEGDISRDVRQAEQRLVALETEKALRGRSVWWVVGTSLVFEAAVLTLAAWRFRRRDF